MSGIRIAGAIFGCCRSMISVFGRGERTVRESPLGVRWLGEASKTRLRIPCANIRNAFQNDSIRYEAFYGGGYFRNKYSFSSLPPCAEATCAEATCAESTCAEATCANDVDDAVTTVTDDVDGCMVVSSCFYSRCEYNIL
jgi:hypothetical protein